MVSVIRIRVLSVDSPRNRLSKSKARIVKIASSILPEQSDSKAHKMNFIDQIDQKIGKNEVIPFLQVMLSLFPDRSPSIRSMIDLELTSKGIRTGKLPVNGNDLTAMGISGKRVGQVIDWLKFDYRNGKWKTQEEGLKRALQMARENGF